VSAFVVGLTGGIGCGKSTVGAEFVSRGIEVVDADAVSHAMTAIDAPGSRAIRAQLGARFFRSDGSLDRAALRSAVFADPALKQRLEAILHPLIRAEIARVVDAWTGPYGILMVPLLIEGGEQARSRYDRLLVVDCPEEEQVRRVVARSGMAPDEVRAIMRTQVDRATRLAAADDVIDNGGALSSIRDQVARLDALYRELAMLKAAAEPRLPPPR
jgi:dephospho-CoA kinase